MVGPVGLEPTTRGLKDRPAHLGEIRYRRTRLHDLRLRTTVCSTSHAPIVLDHSEGVQGLYERRQSGRGARRTSRQRGG